MEFAALKLPVFLGMLLLMFGIETLWPKRGWSVPRRKRFLFHAELSIFNTILTRLLIAGPVMLWVHYVADKGWGLAPLLGLQGIPEIIATFIVYDAYDYWWHRFNHVVPFLWRFHQVHHMDTAVDVTTSLRFHPGELFLSYIAKAMWVLAWGPSVLAFVICEMGITFFSQFHHSNIDLGDKTEKMLRWVHMTPRLHAAHHTVNTRTRNANYSTIFLIWDRLFATLREADFQEMKQLGLQQGRDNYMSFIGMLKAPFLKVQNKSSV